MRKIAYIVIVIGAITFIAAIISRYTLIPLALGPGGGIKAHSLVTFTNTCLLVAITFILLGKRGNKE